jgi:DeoR/GlpR family transcriptional regulator of sugar metabolism
MAEPTYDEVLQFVQQHSCPFVTTNDVAERFDGVSDRTIRNRLHDLVQQNRLKRRQVGAHAKVWYLPAQDKESDSTPSPSSLTQ